MIRHVFSSDCGEISISPFPLTQLLYYRFGSHSIEKFVLTDENTTRLPRYDNRLSAEQQYDTSNHRGDPPWPGRVNCNTITIATPSLSGFDERTRPAAHNSGGQQRSPGYYTCFPIPCHADDVCSHVFHVTREFRETPPPPSVNLRNARFTSCYLIRTRWKSTPDRSVIRFS